MQAEACLLQTAMPLDIVQQVKAEFIQPKVKDGDPCTHLFQIDNLSLQALELLTAIFQVSFFFVRE